MNLAGKTALITGGTSGIGLATALAMIQRGAQVIVSGRTERSDTLALLHREARNGGSAHFLKADVSNKEECKRLASDTLVKYKAIDVLVHSAGGGVPGSLMDISEPIWEQAFDMHVHAIFHLARAVVPSMKQRGEGAIILISSVAGLRGVPGIVAYGTVKGALPQMTRMMARDLADANIRVNCISPGIIRTPFHDRMTAEQKENNLKNRIPLHREGTPEDVASAIIMACENDFMTGENIVIDGGMTMRIV